jgi:hypothetical protein
MARSTRRHILLFLLATGVGLPIVWFLAPPLVFFVLAVLMAFNLFIWTSLAAAHLVSRVRFGAPMTLDEVLRCGAPIRRVQLLRYHLGWSPDRIASELNRRGLLHDARPWNEEEVKRIAGRVGRVF